MNKKLIILAALLFYLSVYLFSQTAQTAQTLQTPQVDQQYNSLFILGVKP